jgi:isocitrate dehydrogenase (NAD+)
MPLGSSPHRERPLPAADRRWRCSAALAGTADPVGAGAAGGLRKLALVAGANGSLCLTVLDGDETGQELLEQALRVLDPEVCGVDVVLERFDLSLEHRRATDNQVVRDAAASMRETGLGIKAATVTPEGADDVGSPNRILREEIGGSVIIRTGRRIPGVTPVAGIHHPIAVVRMAVGDAYGAEQWREGEPGSPDEVALRTERITREVCRSVAEYAFRSAARMGACVYGGPKWTVSPVYEGMLKEEMDAAAERHPEVAYRPTLIDATYAGLVSGVDEPLVIPALNRDGDCLSDLVLPLYGSIAGAESMLLALDDELEPSVAMAEAPHGTAPTLFGRDVANPLAMILAAGAVLSYVPGEPGEPLFDAARAASQAIQDAALQVTASGIRTLDLGGESSTTEVADAVVERVRAQRAT